MDGQVVSVAAGIDTRAYFAAHALVLIASPEVVTSLMVEKDGKKKLPLDVVADIAVSIADKLIARLTTEPAKEGQGHPS
jgi:hypothetical protein